jgi:hypothetical protein
MKLRVAPNLEHCFVARVIRRDPEIRLHARPELILVFQFQKHFHLCFSRRSRRNTSPRGVRGRSGLEGAIFRDFHF